MRLGYEPEGAVEKSCHRLNIVERRVEGHLDRLKEFIESPGEVKPTGDVRGS